MADFKDGIPILIHLSDVSSYRFCNLRKTAYLCKVNRGIRRRDDNPYRSGGFFRVRSSDGVGYEPQISKSWTDDVMGSAKSPPASHHTSGRKPPPRIRGKS